MKILLVLSLGLSMVSGYTWVQEKMEGAESWQEAIEIGNRGLEVFNGESQRYIYAQLNRGPDLLCKNENGGHRLFLVAQPVACKSLQNFRQCREVLATAKPVKCRITDLRGQTSEPPDVYCALNMAFSCSYVN